MGQYGRGKKYNGNFFDYARWRTKNAADYWGWSAAYGEKQALIARELIDLIHETAKMSIDGIARVETRYDTWDGGGVGSAHIGKIFNYEKGALNYSRDPNAEKPEYTLKMQDICEISWSDGRGLHTNDPRPAMRLPKFLEKDGYIHCGKTILKDHLTQLLGDGDPATDKELETAYLSGVNSLQSKFDIAGTAPPSLKDALEGFARGLTVMPALDWKAVARDRGNVENGEPVNGWKAVAAKAERDLLSSINGMPGTVLYYMRQDFRRAEEYLNKALGRMRYTHGSKCGEIRENLDWQLRHPDRSRTIG